MPRSFLVKKQQKYKKWTDGSNHEDYLHENSNDYFNRYSSELTDITKTKEEQNTSLHDNTFQETKSYEQGRLHALADICLLDIEKRKQRSQGVLPETYSKSSTMVFHQDHGDSEFPEEVLRTLCLMRNTSKNLKKLLAVPEDRQDETEQGNQLIIDSPHTNSNTTTKLFSTQQVDRELQKMLKGSQEVIQRELKDFFDNNRFTEKEIVKETGLTIVDASRFLLDAWHTKEEKREIFFKWYIDKKLSKAESDSFTCYKCGKIFAYESYLDRHVKYVCPDKTGRTWKCTYCSKAFQYPCYLRRHMRSHTGESPYKCTQCSRAFVRSTDLQRHLRNHSGEKPYKCQECMRAFARSTDLKRHMRTHTGEKPYKCWNCSKAFSQSGSLQTHLHTHYKEAVMKKDMVTAERLKSSIRKKLINKPLPGL